MKRKIFFACYCFVCISCSVFAQKEQNIWYFGPKGAGLDFNQNCTPTVLTDGWDSLENATQLFEGSVTACDSNGKLLFYTGSMQVINANHKIMPNGSTLGPGANNTSGQNVIVRKPGTTNIYYIITPEIQSSGMLNAQGSPGYRGSIIYSVVDMDLDGGLGDVVSYGNILKDTSTGHSCEKLTTVRHANGRDIWVLAHEFNSNNFNAYLVSPSGIDTVPVVSSVGQFIAGTKGSVQAIGELKANPAGNKLAFTCFGNGLCALFDFDKSTGLVSNPMTLLSIAGNKLFDASGYGVSFSSNSKLLYISEAIRDSLASPYNFDLLQYDVSSADSVLIQNSKKVLFTATNPFERIYSLKLGPDRKIYAGKLGDPNTATTKYLGVINAPDLPGLNARYEQDGLYLDGLDATWGLNNTMELTEYCNTLLTLSSTVTSTNTSCQNGLDGTITANPVGGQAPYYYVWSTSPVQTTQTATGLAPGIYSVTVTDTAANVVVNTDTIKAGPILTPGHITAVRDTVCQGTPGNLTLSNNTDSVFHWQSAATPGNFSTIPGATDLTYHQVLTQTTYFRVIGGSGACTDTSNTAIIIVPPTLTALFTSTVTGFTASFNSDSSIGDIVSYNWDFGDTIQSAEKNPAHTYTKSDTFNVCLTVYDGSNCSYTYCRDVVAGVNSVAPLYKENNWVIYPNPFASYLTIDFKNGNSIIEGIEMLDMLGRQLMVKNIDRNIKGALQIDLSGLANGIYCLKIRTNDYGYIQKIIKQN